MAPTPTPVRRIYELRPQEGASLTYTVTVRSPTDEVVSVTGVAADEDRDGAFVPEGVASGPVQVPPGEEADVTVEGTVTAAGSARRTCRSRSPARAAQRRRDVDVGARARHPGRDPGAGLLMAPLRWVLFDLNGTLVDPAVMAQPLGDSAADEALVTAAVDDAIQLAMVVTLTGREAEFAELVRAGLRRRLRLAGRDPSAADEALGLMGAMPAFIDAPAALERLRGIGLQLGVLTQSSAAAADAVLRFAGLRDASIVVSAAESSAFKPDPRPYRMALERVESTADEVALVAAHWWDVAGAKRAGLRTGWVARHDLVLPDGLPEPDVGGRDLLEVAEAWPRSPGAAALGATPGYRCAWSFQVVRPHPEKSIPSIPGAVLEHRDAGVGVAGEPEPGRCSGSKSSPNSARPRKKCSQP